jgi:hypothetical protein
MTLLCNNDTMAIDWFVGQSVDQTRLLILDSFDSLQAMETDGWFWPQGAPTEWEGCRDRQAESVGVNVRVE